MWTLDRLREVAAERGETSGTPDFGKLLLAHERFRGRTEEAYPRDRAGRELDAMLDRLSEPLPVACADEYPGLRQLRMYAAGRARQRVAGLSKQLERVSDMASAGLARSSTPAHETERERG